MSIDFVDVVAALAGGAIGAALGGLLVFALMGVLCIGAVGAVAAGASAASVTEVALGPVFGPHVSFAGAVGAAAWAAHTERQESGRDIVGPLLAVGGSRILGIGAIFGLIGYLASEVAAATLTATGSAGVEVSLTDPLAIGVVASGLVAWALWGRGSKERAAWLPWQHQPIDVVVVGLAFGLAAGAVTLLWPEESRAMAPVALFGFSAITLIGFQSARLVPVSHHITLPASSAALLSLALGSSAEVAILAAGAAGVAGSVLAELWARGVLERSRTHVDPPAAAIAVVTAALAVINLTFA